MNVRTLAGRASAAVLLLAVVAIPMVASSFFTSAVALTALWMGLAAASLTFLAGYGGMISLAQTGLFGVAGFLAADLSVDRGMHPWAAGLIGIGAAVVVGLVFGAVASGSQGIYFLMITLAFAVITYSYFAAVPTFGAHEGINGVLPPSILGDPVLAPARMYYLTLAVCVLVYLAVTALTRTAFGLALQGVRDDPVRMEALGFNVRLHRTLAFAVAAAIAGIAGVLSVWSNTRISAGSISLSIAIYVLTAAVIGGLYRLEGAWVGSFVFVVLDTYLRGFSDRFATWLGVAFLVIVLASPGGLAGLVVSLGERWGLARRRPGRAAADAASGELGDRGGPPAVRHSGAGSPDGDVSMGGAER
ncbi:branched-chain amino acid ABC transporter permease [Isoptericola sp. b490]|uniref:branched-chain amino acid ABC transporter permease n=1 Tax=Actinotalea lenta TaxID=3064654 RepID=UPI0027125F7C|nr:branched-chain amino acid ABC transporter permease [Isoptericola sp. b490]MDO8119761.1 branched-chain amino acid ABC transporter permease [Isoptericola sp. b490]